jgi:hypothetical protein
MLKVIGWMMIGGMVYICLVSGVDHQIDQRHSTAKRCECQHQGHAWAARERFVGPPMDHGVS